MGCGSSANKIHVVGTTEPAAQNSPTKAGRPKSKTLQIRAKAETDIVEDRNVSRVKRQGSKQGWGSQDSLGSIGSGGDGRRGTSATSKVSHHSMDSGFADTEYARVVTEFSEAGKVKEVEEEFETPRSLDLGVNGTACSQRSSAKDKNRMDEQRVMASLRDEGFIQRPVSRAACGMSFDIVAENAGMFSEARRPPPRLAKLEKRKKKKRALTEEQIQQKLLRAEERKKEQEQQRLAKIQALHKTDIQNALDSFATRQQTVEETVKSREEQVAENREKRLKEMRDKLKAKQEHAENVRRRKKMAPIQIADSPRSGANTARSLDGKPLGYNVDASLEE